MFIKRLDYKFTKHDLINCCKPFIFNNGLIYTIINNKNLSSKVFAVMTILVFSFNRRLVSSFDQFLLTNYK